MADKGQTLPKFGEWDVNDPASAEGYTVIFNKARNEKRTGGSLESPTKDNSTTYKATDTLGKPQSVSSKAFLKTALPFVGVSNVALNTLGCCVDTASFGYIITVLIFFTASLVLHFGDQLFVVIQHTLNYKLHLFLHHVLLQLCIWLLKGRHRHLFYC